MSKLVHNISTGTSEVVELTQAELDQRATDEAAALADEQTRAETQAKIDKAVAFLMARNYKAAYDMVQANANLTAFEKAVLGELVKNNAAIATILNQINILIDLDTMV